MTAYRCGRCGYGISVAKRPLPACPMCRSQTWKPEKGSHRKLLTS